MFKKYDGRKDLSDYVKDIAEDPIKYNNISIRELLLYIADQILDLERDHEYATHRLNFEINGEFYEDF